MNSGRLQLFHEAPEPLARIRFSLITMATAPGSGSENLPAPVQATGVVIAEVFRIVRQLFVCVEFRCSHLVRVQLLRVRNGVDEAFGFFNGQVVRA